MADNPMTQCSPDIEGARLSNWLADYSHDLMEEGDFDQEAAELNRAAQWIADHLASLQPATPTGGNPVAPEPGWLKPALDKAAQRASEMPDWMTRQPATPTGDETLAGCGTPGCTDLNCEYGKEDDAAAAAARSSAGSATAEFEFREFREDAFRSMEVQVCPETRTVQFSTSDHGGDHPTSPSAAIDWSAALDLANWIISRTGAAAQAVPDGFVLVPREPTPAMISAGMGEIPEDGSEFEDVESAYRAMVTVALSSTERQS